MPMTLRHGSPEEAGMLPERVARARDLCARWVDEGHTPSLGVCVARRGVIVLHEAFGVLGPGPDSPPLVPTALFAGASVTKAITATLAMQLVEDGLLGLNRPAKDYLPELSGEGTEEILVHHLLTHTTGYPFHTDPPMIEHAARKMAQGFEAPPCPDGRDPIVHQVLSLFWETPYGGAGLFTTPYDMTVFGQAILNGGRYGDVRILSAAAVAAMTRDQIPGVGARFFSKVMDRASWGYGFVVASPTKWRYFDGSLHPTGTLCHPGGGGQNFWIDREHELVGTYFEVTTRVTDDYEFLWNFDLFQNAITAAVEG
jgi:CubicO group peptidase (beta-lactamase class C family)